jgi:hypothetical protein
MKFQSESKKSGDRFESVVLKDLIDRGFETIKQNVTIIGTGCEIDFLAGNKEYVEAKGGDEGSKKRPGAKRTDNVKKAIANASLIKCRYPNIYYVIYFSSRAEPKSYSQEMLDTALEFGIVDEVRYIENTKVPLYINQYMIDLDI